MINLGFKDKSIFEIKKFFLPKNNLTFAAVLYLSPLNLSIMQVTPIQIFVFTQSLVTKIKTPSMELTRVAPGFRNDYKKARGLGRNADALTVLKDVRKFCEEVGWMNEFNRATEGYPEIVAQL